VGTSRITGEDLAAQHTDPEWRNQFLTLVNVVTLLRNSVIPANYKIPDILNKAFALTEAGTRLQSVLTTKHDVPPKEARLMCLLEIAADDLLVSLEKTDFESLIHEISTQVRDGVLRYPNIFGGDLYRRAAELFPDRRERLSSDETRELLDGTPQGVFQVGPIVVGPLGAMISEQRRWLPPDLRVPLQHCADLTCRRVHATHLSTDYDAPINQHFPKMTKVIERRDVVRGAWTEFTGILSEAEDLPYDDLNMTGFCFALGDCFTEGELAQIADRLDVTHDAPLAGLDRATLMQLLWLRSDVELAQAVDALVHTGDVRIPKSEVRRPRLAAIQVGSYGLRTEIGHRGVRQKPESPGIPHLRLSRLIAHLYDRSEPEGLADLSWHMRSVDGATLDDRLEEYLRLTSPAQVVSELVLSRRGHVERALAEMRIDKSEVRLGDLGPADSDEDIVQTLLWKLGFEPEISGSVSADFTENGARMSRAIREAQASAIVDVESIREAGRRLFISLEGVLEDALEYAWWAMMSDHVTAEKPFTHLPSATKPAWDALESWGSTRGSRVRFTGTRTLFPLCRAFGVLADMLENAASNAAAHQRDPSSLPKWVEHTELKEFPYRHTVAFLDLVPFSQGVIIAGLRDVTSVLEGASVSRVRNAMSHFQRSSSNIDDVEKAVLAATQAVERLDRLGFIRVPYTATRITSDEWSRSVVVMRTRDGDEVSFSRPSRIGYVGMPSHTSPQYLVRSAILASPNETLRFRTGDDSPFTEMWSGYPIPRRARRGRFAQEQTTATSVAAASHAVLPQV